ncbi:MAG: beta-lactamase family protein, partial [Blastocatellia bacterium]|nr:beta-lactamase family protein [Blastocatellia bacterium]
KKPKLHSIVDRIKAKTKVPAISAAIITADFIEQYAVGVRQANGKSQATLNDRFHIGSVTKSVTSTIAAQLVEAGKIKWETTVNEIFPDFASKIDPQLRNVTLEQLLSHRSGLAGYESGEELLSAGNYGGTPVEQRFSFAMDLLTQPPKYRVGSFNYSNAGYGIAGAMIERVAKESWESLVQSSLIDTLGGSALIGWPGFNNPQAPWGHFEKGTLYHQKGELFTAHDPNDPNNLYFRFPSALAPSGDLSLNVNDLSSYVQLHLRGLMGQDTILKSSTVKRLHKANPEPIFGATFYSSGWLEGEIDGVATSLHDGSADTFYCIAAIQPSFGKAAVVIVNAGGKLGNRAAAMTIEKLMGIKNLKTFGQGIK